MQIEEDISNKNSDASHSNKIEIKNRALDTATAAVIVPPDGGWAWVVMVASFACCTVVDGIVFCSGLIQDHILEDFKVSKGYVAFVSSLLSGFYLMAGPFVSALANRFGFRIVTIVGALFAAFCFTVSYYATSVEFLFISYGILGGIGFCMIYIPAVVIIGFYFEKWRALATGLAMCGSGVGTFLFAPLCQVLLEKFGWRGTLVVQGMIILSCAFFGMAFKPLRPVSLDAFKSDLVSNLNLSNEKKLPNKKFCDSIYAKPLPEGRFAYSMPNSAHNTYIPSSSNHHYPTAAEVFHELNIDRRGPTYSGRLLESKVYKTQPQTPKIQGQLPVTHKKELSTVGENEEDIELVKLMKDRKTIESRQNRRHTISGRRLIDIAKCKTNYSEDPSVNTSVRPMYRDDIFYSGSLARIPQYHSKSSLAYHMSVTRLPTDKDVLEVYQKEWRIFPEAVTRILRTMLDTSLLKSPSFMLLAFSGFLTMMGFFVPFTFLVRRSVQAGLTQPEALATVSCIGLINTFARIVCGIMTSFPSIKPLWLNNIAITAGGVATLLSGTIITQQTQMVFAIFFGICIACFSALRSLITVEMIGLEKLTNAFGFLMLFQGIAATIGSPIAGALFDVTGSYDVSFYFAGGLILLSAFLCYPLTYVARWEKRKIFEKKTTASHEGEQ